MVYFDTIFNLELKEILEIIVIVVSLMVVYASYCGIFQGSKKNKQSTNLPALVFTGFLFFFFSMLFELIDSFYFDWLFDKLQLVFEIIAFIILFFGFWQGASSVQKRG